MPTRPSHYMVNRLRLSRIPFGIVGLVGDLHVDRQALDRLVADFHWSVKEFRTIDDLAQANHHNLVAVLFDPKGLSLPLERASRAILEAAPGTLPILCHRFAEVVDRPRLAEFGAFHSLRFSLELREARQTLGFVWAFRRRSAAFSAQVRPRAQTNVSEQTREYGTRAKGMVA